MAEYAIAGVGFVQEPLARLDCSERLLRRQAVEAAIADAGLERTEIDGYITAMGPMDDVRFLGLAPSFACAVDSGGASAATAAIAAIGAIAAGTATAVVCAFGSARARGRSIGDVSHRYPSLWGMSGAVTSHALLAQRYLHCFDRGPEDLAAVALAQRELAQLRPDAQYHGRPLTLEEYMESPGIVEPLRLLDCCRDGNVGAAIVITAAELARERASAPVAIAGLGTGENLRNWYRGESLDRHDEIEPARDRAFAQAGIALADVDVAQLYDPFTISVLMQLEQYGFCGAGEAGDLVADGQTGVGGSVPVNTGGGQLSGGYAISFTPIVEAVRQLRGEGGATQVAGAEVALVSAHGGSLGLPGTWHHATMLLTGTR